MTRSQWNFLIDLLLMLCLAAITGIGLLMHFVLLPGREAQAVYGSGAELALFGMTRHDWGGVHFYVALFMISLLVLHIVLHWGLIVALYRSLVASRPARRALATAFALVCLALVALPAAIPPEVASSSGLGRGRRARGEAPGGTAAVQEGHTTGTIEISGRMTIGEVAEQTGVPVEYLAQRLGIGEPLTGAERLGPLRRDYGFEMQDVRAAVESYRTKQP